MKCCLINLVTNKKGMKFFISRAQMQYAIFLYTGQFTLTFTPSSM